MYWRFILLYYNKKWTTIVIFICCIFFSWEWQRATFGRQTRIHSVTCFLSFLLASVNFTRSSSQCLSNLETRFISNSPSAMENRGEKGYLWGPLTLQLRARKRFIWSVVNKNFLFSIWHVRILGWWVLSCQYIYLFYFNTTRPETCFLA